MARYQTPLTTAHRVFASLVTPSRAGTNEIDVGLLLDYLDRVTHGGVDGLVLFGTAGEFIHFDMPERIRTTSLAIRRSRVPTLVNVSHSTLAGTLAIAESAINLGAAGILLMPPYFYPYSDEDIYAFYDAFLNLTGGQIPVYLYNPFLSTNGLSPSLAQALAGQPDIAGIADGNDDPLLLQALQPLRSAKPFRYFCANDRTLISAWSNGADGIISDIAAAVPELVAALGRALKAADQAGLYRSGARMGELLDWADRFAFPELVKLTAAHRGWLKYEPPFPQADQTLKEFEALRSWLKAWLPAVLKEC